MNRLTTLYFHCFAGASGDMILGALIDVGVPLDEVRRALGSLAIDPDMIWTERVTRAGIGATKFRVRGENAASGDVGLVARAGGSLALAHGRAFPRACVGPFAHARVSGRAFTRL